ncbi:phage baseplate assembly protein V [Mycolicibacterium septicum]|uniref:Phage baseplate assembly protein V n=2 Tax=Mycolicibacterium septicum TaxID=98668 RepID=A0ABW9LWE2_9MYCO
MDSATHILDKTHIVGATSVIIDHMTNERVFGVYRGLVVENIDPELAGRVKIRLADVAADRSLWAPTVQPVVSVAQEVPAVGAEVLVAFEAGDPNSPYVIGGLWREPPIPAVRSLTLRSGHQVVIDEPAQEVRLLHPNGAEIVLESNGGVTITAPMVDVRAAAANFSGTVTCTTMVATSGVVSPSYTPGVGNMM